MKYRYLNSKEIHDDEESKFLKFLYNTFIGRFILKIVISKTISKIVGIFLSSKLSLFMIKKYIKKYNIDMTKYEDKKYKSFNEFFKRKLKEDDFKSNKKDFISTANSKITYYKIDKNLIINIKKSKYNIEEILKNKKMAEEYRDGICLIYRLAPQNYHRYIFCDDGELEYIGKVEGKLHTVKPIAINSKYKIFHENYREISKLRTKEFGDIIQIEVGALCVGKIVNKKTDEFSKYQEKGYFEFGGSTIIQLIKKDKVKINNEIVENTKKDIETLVDIGNIIGEKYKI